MIEAPDWALQTIYDLEHGIEQLEAENARLRDELIEQSNEAIIEINLNNAEIAQLRGALYAVLDDLELRADIRNGERVLNLSHGVLMKAEKALNPTSAGDK